MKKPTEYFLLVAGLGLSIGFGAMLINGAIASEDALRTGDDGYVLPPSGAAGGPALTAEQILQKLRAANYTDVVKIEREGRKVEVKARDASGRLVELYLDPVTGKILKQEWED